MKKLKTKVFLVIFSILTLFLLGILIVFNYKNYYSAKNTIEDNLNRAERLGNDKNNFYKWFMGPSSSILEIEDNHLKFMDSIIYTVILNKNNDIIGVINNSDRNITKEEIIKIAANFINNNKDKKSTGNIYFNKYAYSFHYGSYLIIMDIKDVSSALVSTLRLSLIIFVLLEILIIIISKELTSWIIKPVIETFNKQKQFIADASHELKTPLSVIVVSTEALENDRNEDKWLNNIKNESSRMNDLIKNLLDLAKLDNGNVKESYANNNLSKIINLSSLTYESLMFEQNIKLETNIEDNIYLNSNQEQMKQLIAILLDNAIKHSFKRGKIIVNLFKNKNSVILEVKNKGKAIPKEDEEKIFERFYRADESRNRTDGRYGLGLAIAKSIVTNHNGIITACSSDGITTFKVVFKV